MLRREVIFQCIRIESSLSKIPAAWRNDMFSREFEKTNKNVYHSAVNIISTKEYLRQKTYSTTGISMVSSISDRDLIQYGFSIWVTLTFAMAEEL